MDYLYSDLTRKVIACFYKVYNKIGYGFLEKVYERALLIELRRNQIKSISQIPITVFYEELEVGNYFADILIEDRLIIELKAEESIHPAHEAQLTNYLKATNIQVGLLLNFGKQPQFKRKVFTNDLRKSV